jgi:hypothetical protein
MTISTEAQIAAVVRYYAAHPQVLRDAQKKYYQNHTQTIREQQKQYYATNADEINRKRREKRRARRGENKNNILIF